MINRNENCYFVTIIIIICRRSIKSFITVLKWLIRKLLFRNAKKVVRKKRRSYFDDSQAKRVGTITGRPVEFQSRLIWGNKVKGIYGRQMSYWVDKYIMMSTNIISTRKQWYLKIFCSRFVCFTQDPILTVKLECLQHLKNNCTFYDMTKNKLGKIGSRTGCSWTGSRLDY